MSGDFFKLFAYPVIYILVVTVGALIFHAMAADIGGGRIKWSHAFIVMALAAPFGFFGIGAFIGGIIMYAYLRIWGDADCDCGEIMTIIVTVLAMRFLIFLLLLIAERI